MAMADGKKVEAEEVQDDELDQIIRDMAEEEDNAPAMKATPLKAVKNSAKKEADQSLTMELTGVINLKLCFASGERSIEVLCTEEALLCRMADGTEFRIPTGIAKKRNAA
jgi:hypothetical protein